MATGGVMAPMAERNKMKKCAASRGAPISTKAGAQSMDTMVEAGEAIWEATDFTKKIITVEYSAVKMEV